ncbi:Uncharacterised protein [Vibrio cholerae]|nr:Uncharacterised protein [Vibrio cholerae]CSI54106.1 Uncharacterised protein [Vibrio cholerae]CSI59502.1 Uncharacterised protein [Vibrio cholerae]
MLPAVASQITPYSGQVYDSFMANRIRVKER